MFFRLAEDSQNEITTEMETENENETTEDSDKIVIIDPDSEVCIFFRNCQRFFLLAITFPPVALISELLNSIFIYACLSHFC